MLGRVNIMRIENVDWQLTSRCNRMCPYCFGPTDINDETTIVIRTPRCWTTMVVFVFALQIAAFSSRTFLIQLDTGFQTP